MVAFYLVSLLLLCVIYAWHRQKQRLPPGPTPLPLIGNILQLPNKAPWEAMKELGAKYGPIMTVKFGFRTVIILNTRDAARDLLEKRANVYSSRPRMISFSEYLFRNTIPVAMPYTPEWLALHRLQLRILNPRAARASAHIQALSVKWFMSQLLDGTAIADKVAWLAVNASSTLVFGTPVGSATLSEAHEIGFIVAQIIDSICIENILVDLFPFLDRIPGVRQAGMKRGDAVLDTVSRTMDDKLYKAVHSPSWSMARGVYQNQPADMTWEGFRIGVVEMHLAASAGTPLTLNAIILMAALHPDEVRKVRDEIDRIVGSDRLPSLEDWDQLPLVHAFIAECLRFRTTVPFSMPHATTHDDEYMGYRIPSDALILANQWAYNNDEDAFDEPQKFNPQRWIHNPDLPRPSTFGFGKRMCPGRHSVEKVMFLVVASMMWGYDLTAKEGVTDEPVKGKSLVFQADLSGVRYSCRSAKYKEVIEREWNDVNPDVSSLLNDLGGDLGM
ncbi:hypothetical protein AWENTII_006854 [Aspergillus wentii]|nr:hypothetical protein MW887_004332 [Aspergillus wentii]